MIEDLAHTTEMDAYLERIERRGRGEDIPPVDHVDGTGPFVMACDGCDTRLPKSSSRAMAVVTAASAGWSTQVEIRKFSGRTLNDYCPKCRSRES